jgi:hypothetical protein
VILEGHLQEHGEVRDVGFHLPLLLSGTIHALYMCSMAENNMLTVCNILSFI